MYSNLIHMHALGSVTSLDKLLIRQLYDIKISDVFKLRYTHEWSKSAFEQTGRRR